MKNISYPPGNSRSDNEAFNYFDVSNQTKITDSNSFSCTKEERVEFLDNSRIESSNYLRALNVIDTSEGHERL